MDVTLHLPSSSSLPSGETDLFHTQWVVQFTGHEKITAGGLLLRCGAGGMFTNMWTRGLLLMESTTSQRITLVHTVYNIKQIKVACSDFNCTMYCGRCDNIFD
jgi:hypothetical protein